MFAATLKTSISIYVCRRRRFPHIFRIHSNAQITPRIAPNRCTGNKYGFYASAAARHCSAQHTVKHIIMH